MGLRDMLRQLLGGGSDEPAGELEIEDLSAGAGQTATDGSTVSVHYTGWLTDGQKFDSSHDRAQPFSFRIGARQVIAGWEQGVAGMQVGGKRRLTIPPHLAYGRRRTGPIPANSTLIFEIDLLQVR